MGKNIKQHLKKIVITSLASTTEASHDISHLENVANLTQPIGDILNYSDKEKILCYAAGWLHDLVRSPSEDPNSGDEEKSAQQARILIGKVTENGEFSFSSKEINAVAGAIIHHTNFPPWFKNKRTRNILPTSLENKILLALFIADYIEANGAMVIARRCNFVGGVRLHTPLEKGGDLQKFDFIPGKDEGLVVALESILRLTFINPEEFYPNHLYTLVHPLYEVQREFVLGLFKGLNLKVGDLIKILRERRGPDGGTILESRNIRTPKDIGQFRKLVKERGGISDSHISQVSSDVANSAIEALEYFSASKFKQINRAIKKWRPKGKTAKKWKRKMIESRVKYG